MSACSWIHLIEPRYGVNTATVQTTFPAFLSERSLCTLLSGNVSQLRSRETLSVDREYPGEIVCG
jgi:hypothetical protein